MASHGEHSSGSQLVEMQGTLRLTYPMLPDLGCLLSYVDIDGCIGKVMFQYLPKDMVSAWRKCLSPRRPLRVKIDSWHQLSNFEVDGIVSSMVEMPNFSEVNLVFHQLTPVQSELLKQAVITARASDANLPAVRSDPNMPAVYATPQYPPPPLVPAPAKVYPVPVSFDPPPLKPKSPPMPVTVLRSDVPNYEPPKLNESGSLPKLKPNTILEAFKPGTPGNKSIAPLTPAAPPPAPVAPPPPDRNYQRAAEVSYAPPAVPTVPIAPAPPEARGPFAPPPMPAPSRPAALPSFAPPAPMAAPMRPLQPPAAPSPLAPQLGQSSTGKKKIGMVLLQMGYINAAQLDEAARLARMKGEKIGRYLVRSGIVGPDVMCRALALQSGLPMTDLNDLEISEELTKLFSYSTMMRHGFVPFDESKEMICIAVANPLSQAALRDLEQSASRKIEVFLGREDLILKTLNKIRARQQVVPRRFIRYDLHTQLTYQYCTRFGVACEEPPQQGTTVNISEGGLLIEGTVSNLGKPDELLRRGTCVNVTIPFTPPQEIHALCRLKAIQDHKGGWLIGLEMLEISSEDKRRLKELCVRALLTKIPSKRGEG